MFAQELSWQTNCQTLLTDNAGHISNIETERQQDQELRVSILVYN